MELATFAAGFCRWDFLLLAALFLLVLLLFLVFATGMPQFFGIDLDRCISVAFASGYMKCFISPHAAGKKVGPFGGASSFELPGSG